jgi:hypothetical protein
MRWYVIELKGGGLIGVGHTSDLRLVHELRIPNFSTLSRDDFSVLEDYDTKAEAMAFIAGLELGHERREDVRQAMNKRLEQVLDKYQGVD